jgi:hypothetical protein
MTVKIFTQTVGQYFATCAVVKHGSTVLYRTRDYPFGMTGPAYEAAENWATEHGHTVI